MSRAAALSAWALAVASVSGAIFGVTHHALLVAVGFRALTAWRLSVAGGVVWRGETRRPWTVRLAALGSAAAHLAIGSTVLLSSVPALHVLCASAARCSPVPAAMLPLALAGLFHAAWLWRAADQGQKVIV